MRRTILFLFVLLGGCGRYEDFTLPPVDGQDAEITPRWQVRPEPVLGRGAAGEWDSVDVLNPSVIRWQNQLLNLYSGFDGRLWHTGMARSADGIGWEKQGKRLSPEPAGWEAGYIAANGAALVFKDEIYYWYQAGNPPRIGLARSRDGARFQKHPEPVIDLGPRGSWDERAAADPYVIQSGEELYMFYLGEDRARRQRLGVARSRDGIRWWKLLANPVLELGQPGAFDENGLGEPAVFTAHGRYWMIYTGRDQREARRLGLASSPDGVRWQRAPEETVLTGPHAWNSKVMCDPTVEAGEGHFRVWFGGGDIAHPAENIHGQIGLATLTLEKK
ncbi:MAG: hypothetical protein FJW20_14440 [Acidimicrobiia bacterium]|nr:hypothetical protein [Acidimicrobiia bacterium]